MKDISAAIKKALKSARQQNQKCQEITTRFDIYNGRRVLTLIDDGKPLESRLCELAGTDGIHVRGVPIGNGHCVEFANLDYPIIVIPRKPHLNVEYATVAHEALHATIYLLKDVGITIGKETAESFTHTMQFIIKDVLDKAK